MIHGSTFVLGGVTFIDPRRQGLTVYTASLRYSGKDRLDISRQGNDPVGVLFAPSWDLLRRYLPKFAGERLTPDRFAAYREEYLAEMRVSLTECRAAWNAFLARRGTVTLCCVCPDGSLCHRLILREAILPKMGARDGGERG